MQNLMQLFYTFTVKYLMNTQQFSYFQFLDCIITRVFIVITELIFFSLLVSLLWLKVAIKSYVLRFFMQDGGLLTILTVTGGGF